MSFPAACEAVNPNGNEQTRVKCASPCRAYDGVNTLIKGIQIQLSNELQIECAGCSGSINCSTSTVGNTIC